MSQDIGDTWESGWVGSNVGGLRLERTKPTCLTPGSGMGCSAISSPVWVLQNVAVPSSTMMCSTSPPWSLPMP